MNKTIRNLAVLGSSIVVLSFGVFVVNQTAQVVQLAATFHPGAGRIVLFALIGAHGVLVAVPVVMVVRLPKPLEPPTTRDGPEYIVHLDRLRGRLRVNRF